MKFGDAIRLLTDAEIDFVVVDGVSASLHGSAHLTFDLDICYSRAKANIQKLAAALKAINPRPRDFPPGLPFVWDEFTLRNSTVLTLNTALGKIDLLAEISGVGTYDDAREHSVEVDAYDRTVRILSLPALIQAKRAAGRSKDLLVLPELESLAEANAPDSSQKLNDSPK